MSKSLSEDTHDKNYYRHLQLFCGYSIGPHIKFQGQASDQTLAGEKLCHSGLHEANGAGVLQEQMEPWKAFLLTSRLQIVSCIEKRGAARIFGDGLNLYSIDS
jgi:hypothetical protein